MNLRRRYLLASINLTILAAAFSFGFLLSISQPADPVLAACGTSFNCTNDDTATASLEVRHQTTDISPKPVEPDSGETWAITATWSTDTTAPFGCTCQDLGTASVTVDVEWSDATGWSANCTGCDPTNGPIYSVDVCSIGDCPQAIKFDGYELIVDIEHLRILWCPIPERYSWAYLDNVDFQTTSIDDGNEVDPNYCTDGASVSPTSQSFSASDTGAFECAFDCASVTGASVTITYE